MIKLASLPEGLGLWQCEPTPPPPPPKTQTEIEMDKYDTLSKIVQQLESCNYETEAGFFK